MFRLSQQIGEEIRILNKLPAAAIDCMANDLESDMVSLFYLIVLGLVLAKFHHNLIVNSLATPNKSNSFLAP